MLKQLIRFKNQVNFTKRIVFNNSKVVTTNYVRNVRELHDSSEKSSADNNISTVNNDERLMKIIRLEVGIFHCLIFPLFIVNFL